MIDPTRLPDDLPAPDDDGATDHLPGTARPAIALAATDGSTVHLVALEGVLARGGRPAAPAVSDRLGRRSDLTRALDLPTFDVDGMTLIKRLTLIVRDGVIDDVVYPVFPPDRGAELALERL